MLNMEWEKRLQNICGKCWQQIWEFHQFQQSIIEAQKYMQLQVEATKEVEEVKIKSELHINQQEAQLELHITKRLSAVTEDLIKPTTLTFDIKTEEPLDLNSDYEGMSSRVDEQDHLTNKEISLMMSNRKENPSLQNDDESNDDYSSSDDMLLSSLDKTNLCSSDKKVPASKKSVEKFDEMVALWRSSLECEICHQLVASYSQLKEHFAKNHTSEICYIMCCQLRLETRNNIDRHIRYHNAPQQLKCESCCRAYRHMRYLREHERKVHTSKGGDKSAKDSKKSERKYRCMKCSKDFTTEKHMNQHNRYIHKLKNLECNLCEKTFFRPHALREHLASHKGERAHVCSVCPKTFTWRSNFSRHMRKSHPQEWKRIQNEAAQTESLREYQDEQDHLTDEEMSLMTSLQNDDDDEYNEDYSSSDDMSLSSLGQTHISSSKSKVPTTKRLKCKFCEKSFRRPVLLLEHLASHKGKKTQICSFCPKAFTWRSSLCNHMSKTHPEEWTRIQNDSAQNGEAQRHTLREYRRETRGKCMIYICIYCTAEYDKRSSMLYHISRCRRESEIKEPKMEFRLETRGESIVYICIYCSEEHEKRISMQNHIKCCPRRNQPTESEKGYRQETRGESIVYICSYCSREYENRFSIYGHIRRCQGSDRAIDSKKGYRRETRGASMVYVCIFCSKEYRNRESINYHIYHSHRDEESLARQQVPLLAMQQESSQRTPLTQDSLNNWIIGSNTSDVANITPDGYNINELGKEGEAEEDDSLMTPVEGTEWKYDENATSTNVKTEQLSADENSLENEEMNENDVPQEFEDAAWESGEFLKSEEEFIEL
uniref:C2H2-type domain-containing protein n=1 Tax=Stomoxys calcitrans TaxID=35570 RepID=A0A1I8PKE2_STOCA